MDLHQQLIEQSNDAPEGQHAANGGDVDGDLGVWDELEADKSQPDRAGQADTEEGDNSCLEMTSKLIRYTRVENVHDDC